MADFAHPRPLPSRITYMSASASYSVFGWQVTMRRAVEEFSTLVGAGTSGFELDGSGSATVLTPARYRRGARYRIVVRSQSGARTLRERAGRVGRLRIAVPLGPSDTVQEYPADGPPIGTTMYRTHVTITPVRSRSAQ